MKGKKQAVITRRNAIQDPEWVGSRDIQYFGLLDINDQKPTMSWEITRPRKLATVNADIRKQENVQSNPSYVVVEADGTIEVIEHRCPGDVFYVNDDPSTGLKLGLPVKPSPGSAPSN